LSGVKQNAPVSDLQTTEQQTVPLHIRDHWQVNNKQQTLLGQIWHFRRKTQQ